MLLFYRYQDYISMTVKPLVKGICSVMKRHSLSQAHMWAHGINSTDAFLSEQTTHSSICKQTGNEFSYLNTLVISKVRSVQKYYQRWMGCRFPGDGRVWGTGVSMVWWLQDTLATNLRYEDVVWVRAIWKLPYPEEGQVCKIWQLHLWNSPFKWVSSCHWP